MPGNAQHFIHGLLKDVLGSLHPQLAKINQLWTDLCKNVFPNQQGPFPAAHGEQHIANVLTNLACLLKGLDPSVFEVAQMDRRVELFIGAMIHDAGMVDMQRLSNESVKEESRIDHANRNAITQFAKQCVDRVLPDCWNDALEIAQAHAGDSQQTEEEKFEEVKERASKTGRPDLPLSVALVRLADLLDIGPKRLVSYCDKCDDWPPDQVYHLTKHSLLQGDIRHDLQRITIEVKDNEARLSSPAIACAALRREYDAVVQAVNLLNEQLLPHNQSWNLARLDTALFGEIYPLSRDVGLFQRQFREAHRNIKPGDVLEVDLMGHTAYGRFVSNEEGLNDELRRLLTVGQLRLRVLLLDPTVENQQMCEVFEAQFSEGRERSILDNYGTPLNEGPFRSEATLSKTGDIRRTLKELEQWCKDVRGRSGLEVRLTTRILYGNLTRFGNRMIFSPYKSAGLFRESPAIVLTDKAALFGSYKDEFESVWEDVHATRLHTFVWPEKDNCPNPLRKRFGHRAPDNKAVPALDYET